MKIVWVFGSSAAGKETFIRKIAQKPPHDIVSKLGWDAFTIEVLEESMAYIGKVKGDPVERKRLKIPSIIKHMRLSQNISQNNLLLIKGQNFDIAQNIPSKVRCIEPSADHSIVFLYADLETLIRRSRRKPWWSKEDEDAGKEGLREWIQEGQIYPISQMEGFEKIAVDSNTPNYLQIGFPPSI
jgi:hypothetical protein